MEIAASLCTARINEIQNKKKSTNMLFIQQKQDFLLMYVLMLISTQK